MLQLERGRGETLFDGRTYRQLRKPMRSVGVLLGPAEPDSGRRLGAHLAMFATAGGIHRRRVDEVIDLVGLTPVARARCGTLSQGALTRLGLATALLGDPDTLILDEPAAGLDPPGTRWLHDFLRAYAAQGRTVLTAGHILTQTVAGADHIVLLSRGRAVVDEPATDFLRRAAHRDVQVRTPQVERLAGILRAEGAQVARSAGTTMTVYGMDRAHVGEAAYRAGIKLHELTEGESRLSDAFATAVAELRAARGRPRPTVTALTPVPMPKAGAQETGEQPVHRHRPRTTSPNPTVTAVTTVGTGDDSDGYDSLSLFRDDVNTSADRSQA
jgi:ABC-2 type transport system ATP-binding protein